MDKKGFFSTLLPFFITGVIATLLEYGTYLACDYGLGMWAVCSNILAWAVGVVSAFIGNKQFVFCSRDWHLRVLFKELAVFAGCRVVTGLMETGAIFVCVDLIGWKGYLVKPVTSLFSGTANYIIGKFFVFRDKAET